MNALEPIVDWIGDFPLMHGERAEMDTEHPQACLCGFEDYLLCPEFITGGIASCTIHPGGIVTREGLGESD